jgi:uncharacterized phage-like protein YoqJ
MKNQEVIKNFENGIKSKVKSMFSEVDYFKRLVLYSYHFPIAIKLNNCYLVNKDSYSSTTTRHQNLFKNYCGGEYILLSTEELKQIISSKNYQTKEDFVEDKI